MNANSSGRARAEGLEGVVVAATELSLVDGLNGRLVLCGEALETLAGTQSYEAVVERFWNERLLPAAGGTPELRVRLGRARSAAYGSLPGLGRALDAGDAMAALQSSLSQLERQSDGEDAVAALGAAPVFAAAWARRRNGLGPIQPDPERGQAEDLLRMLGAASSEASIRALDSYWISVIDHGLNASTFAARVVASTQSDLISALVAALGALKGPLHGGAPGPVLDMLDAIAEPERAEAWLERELSEGRRIMGMGHRVYRVRDPRAAVLEAAVQSFERGAAGAVSRRLALARAVEQAAERVLNRRHPERALRANVEFYTAVLLEALGVPRQLFSAVFACSRIAGWAAHVAEQRQVGRLIRPRSEYVGELPQL